MNNINKIKLENKIKSQKDFLNWNKKFTKKLNVIALHILGINVLMTTPVILYSMGILTTLSNIKLFYEIGIYGTICGTGVIGTTALLNTVLAVNRIYLNKNNKHLNNKIEKNNNEEFLTSVKQNTKTLEEQKNESNQLIKKSTEDKSKTYKYNLNQESNYITNSMSLTNDDKSKKNKTKKRIIIKNYK